MATIDYKQKIKDYMNSSEVDTLYKSMLNNLFPELRESEDERIRKEIITHIKWCEDSGYCAKEEMTRWINWLEKQGEPTEINPSEFDLQLNRLLKQFESLPKEDLASSLSFYLNVVQNDGTYKEEKQYEQKQEWSEDDEYHKRQILRILKDNGCSQTLQEKTEKWIEERLKSLRPQSTWKPSERQKEALLWCVVHLGGADKQTLGELLEELNKL